MGYMGARTFAHIRSMSLAQTIKVNFSNKSTVFNEHKIYFTRLKYFRAHDRAQIHE
eukprot:UN11528